MKKLPSQPWCKICQGRLVGVCDHLYDERYGYPHFYEARRCHSCGLVQTLPPLANADLSDLYTNYYPRQQIDPAKIKTAGASFRPTVIWRAITWLAGRSNIGHYQTKVGEIVLDVACGDGLSLLEIKALGGQPFGTETDRNLRKVAKALGLNLFIGDLRDAPFSKKSFDLVTGSQIIEHVPDPLEFLLTIRKMLKPGGRVIIATPNFGGVYRQLFGRRWINWHIPYHQNLFDAKSLSYVCEAGGFVVIKKRTVTPNLWTLLQLVTLIQPSSPGNRHDAVWHSDLRPSLKRFGLRTLFRLVSLVLIVPITLVNRWLDLFGYGDSLVYVLQQK